MRRWVKAGLLAALLALLGWLARKAWRLMWRWRRGFAPAWTAVGVLALASALRALSPSWLWLGVAVAVGGGVVAWVGPRLPDRVREVVTALVPVGLDRGQRRVLDRPLERYWLAALLGTSGAWLAVRVGAGAGPVTTWWWAGASLAFGTTWWYHRRVRVAGRADKYARKWHRISKGEDVSVLLRALYGSKVLRCHAVGVVAYLRVRLAPAVTIDEVSRTCPNLDGFYGLRRGAFHVREEPNHAGIVNFVILPQDPWKGRIAHPLPEPGSISLTSENFTFTMGLQEDGTPDTYALAHTLIVGRSGSGKSGWLESLMIWLSSCSDVMLAGIDMANGATLGMWEDLFALPLATDVDGAVVLLERVLAFLVDREQRLAREKSEGASDDDSVQPSAKTPWLVLIIDEFPDLVSEGGAPVVKLLSRIGKRARKGGLRLIFASQNGSKTDVGSKELQAQLRTVVSLALDSHASRVLWGDMGRQGWNAAGLGVGQYLIHDDQHPAPVVSKAVFATTKERRAHIAAAREHRPMAELSAWAALTGTSAGAEAAVMVELATEAPDEVDEVLALLRREGPRRADELVELLPLARATVFRRLKALAAAGLAHSAAGVWHAGAPPLGRESDEDTGTA